MIDAASRAERGRFGHILSSLMVVVMAAATAHAVLPTMVLFVPTSVMMVVLPMVSVWQLVVR